MNLEDKKSKVGDTISSKGLGPRSFEEYVGQEKLKAKLNIAIEAASARGEALDHLLLYGPPGLGKTTISKLIAKKLNVSIRVTSGPVLDKVGDIASILMSLSANDILFIDEIHRMNKSVEEALYPAMEEGKMDLIIGKGPTAKSVRFNLKKFTIIGATTKASLLSSPLRDRFGLVHRIEPYPIDDLTKIVLKAAALLSLDLNETAAEEIAVRSRATPRISYRLLRRVRDYAQVKGLKEVDLSSAERALDMLDVDSYGLDELDRAIISAIIAKFKGGPVGIEALSIAVGEDKRTIEDVHEPYLLRMGFISRTSRGRVATKLAYEHMEVKQ